MLKQQATDIIDLLQEYQSIWYDEVLNTYPACLKKFPSELKNEITAWNKTIFQEIVVSGGQEGLRDSPLVSKLIKKIKDLSFIENKTEAQSLRGIYDPEVYYQVKGKKEHEFHQIIPLLKKHFSPGNHLVDVGSGIGYLAHMLASQENIPSLCLDQDSLLQEQGQKRWSRYFKAAGPAPIYQTLKVSRPDELAKTFDQNSIVLGLHACGDLTEHILQAAQKAEVPKVVSFGCCYFKRKTTLNKSTFLSNIFQDSNLELSIEALSLATNVHLPPSNKAFKEKQKIKFFRYLFQLILWHECDMKGFLILGPTPLSYYQEWSFEEYFVQQWQRLYNHASPFAYSDVSKLADKWHDEAFLLFKLNSLRSFFGPLIEKAIALDRAIFFEEKGYRVEITKLFNEKISPRNIGIVALK